MAPFHRNRIFVFLVSDTINPECTLLNYIHYTLARNTARPLITFVNIKASCLSWLRFKRNEWNVLSFFDLDLSNKLYYFGLPFRNCVINVIYRRTHIIFMFFRLQHKLGWKEINTYVCLISSFTSVIIIAIITMLLPRNKL